MARIGAHKITVADSTSSGTSTIFFQENFESGDMSSFDFVWSDPLDFNWHASSELVHTGTYAAAGHFRGSDNTSPYTTPSLSQVAGGSQGARTYYVKTIMVDPKTPAGWYTRVYSNESS